MPDVVAVDAGLAHRGDVVLLSPACTSFDWFGSYAQRGEAFADAVNELLAEGWRKILLNLSKVHSIDSAGVGELVQSLRICRRFGADLKLLNLHERVKRSLHLAQLLPVFHVYENEMEALNGFETGAGH